MNHPRPCPSSELNYFEKRAEAELELAQYATHPGAVKAHYQLAGFYLEIVHGDGREAPAELHTMSMGGGGE